MISLPFRRAAMMLSMVAAVTSPANAGGRTEVKDRQGNVIRVVDPAGRRDVPATPALPRAVRAAPAADAASQPRRPAAPGSLAPFAGSDTWPMFQADARHTGFLEIDLDPAQFAFRWARDIGGDFALNPVAGGDGKVYVSLDIRFNDVVSVYALDAGDGHTVWSKNLGPVNSVNPPSFANGLVYVQTGKAIQGIEPFLRALDADTGNIVFQAPFGAQWESYLAPTIYEGNVYINGGYYGGAYSFDAQNGTQRWFAELPQYDMWTPAVDGDRVYSYVGEYEPGLYVLDRASGAEVGFIPDANFVWNGWSMDLAPVVTDLGDVLAIHDGRLISFNTSASTIRFELPGPYTGQPSYHAGRIYAVKSGRLVVLDEVNGAEIWAWTPPVGQIVGPMIVTRTHLIASTAQQVYAVDLATHQDVWSYPAAGQLAMADDRLYIASSDGMLRAITVPGARLAASAMAVDTSAGPASDGNKVLEPGETVAVEPSWFNGYTVAQTFTGTAANFGGPGAPGNPLYSIVDGTADYATVANGSSGSCSATSDCYELGITVPSTRPGTHWDAHFDEDIAPQTLAAAKTWQVHVGESFFDVPRSSPYYRFVETLLHRNVTGGCTTTAFCPAQVTERQQFAVFVLVAKEGSGYGPPACGTPVFSDVPAASPYCAWIEELVRRGVTSGCGGGRFCPTAAVSRQEMAVFVLATKEPGVVPPACGTPMFSDVPASSPYCRWIEELARRGIVAGCGGGAFCPTSPVKREQMAVFLTGTFGLTLYGP